MKCVNSNLTGYPPTGRTRVDSWPAISRPVLREHF